jgi:hypothetical protein
MPLSRRERCALRAIAEDLADDDPALATLLSTPTATRLVITRIVCALFGVSTLLLIFGLLVDAQSLITVAALVFVLSPVLIVVVAGILGHSFAAPDHGGEGNGPEVRQ